MKRNVINIFIKCIIIFFRFCNRSNECIDLRMVWNFINNIFNLFLFFCLPLLFRDVKMIIFSVLEVIFSIRSNWYFGVNNSNVKNTEYITKLLMKKKEKKEFLHETNKY